MLKLDHETGMLINEELMRIPEKYRNPFNSTHEGLGVLREEYIELEQEIFFGEKQVERELEFGNFGNKTASELHKERIRKEAIQVAAMAVRIIQELT